MKRLLPLLTLALILVGGLLPSTVSAKSLDSSTGAVPRHGPSFDLGGLAARLSVQPTVSQSSVAAPAASWDGTDPNRTGCAPFARTIYTTSVFGFGTVDVRYSSGCRTAWARFTLSSSVPACTSFCSYAEIIRNGGGSYRCIIYDGDRSCYTSQVNDAGFTSYAKGCSPVATGGGTGWYCSRTGSY
jgi:hypothetical protein